MASIEKKRKIRFYISIFGVIGLFVIAGIRLFNIQVVNSEKYQKLATKQQNTELDLPATRGIIYDKNEIPIVSNSIFTSYAADPIIVGSDANKTAKYFSNIFGNPVSKYLSILKSNKKNRFVWIERRVHPDISSKINLKYLKGVVSINEPKRLYHLEGIGGQLIGTVNIDNKGIAGIEYRFNDILCGKNGKIIMERDAIGNQRPSMDYPKINPIDGNSVYLTIDQEYQTFAFDEVRKAVDRMKADKGHAILINPKTGAILALVNYPSLNPSENFTNQKDQYKIPAISDSFEPGSVFKLVTAASAIENNSINMIEKFSGENGEWNIKLTKDKIRTIKDTHPHGDLTFQEAMEVSSNIVMAKISNRVGADKFYLTARNFGFGMSTGLELAGEISGELKKPFQWSQTTLNTMSFGYEVGATPLQILQAYSALANNGTLMKPYLVEKIVDQNNEVIFENSPKQIRQVISKRTAMILKNMFVGVVERGTGSEAKIIGIPVAGKTGTSKKYVDGKYQDGVYNASFVGFYPADDPEIAALVIIENPKVGSYYGGQASAPIFRAIAERIVNNKGILTRSLAIKDNLIAEAKSDFIPDLKNIQINSAIKILNEKNIKYSIIGNGDFVLNQFPNSGSQINSETELKLITIETNTNKSFSSSTPNVKGLTIRKAINRLTLENCEIQISGNGIVVEQIVNEISGSKKKITLICSSKSMQNEGLSL